MRCFLILTVFSLCIASPVFAAGFTSDQKKEIGGVVRQYLLDNPSVIFEAAEAHQQKLQAQAAEKGKKVLAERKAEIFDVTTHGVLGEPMAKIAFVEFFDYNCGYCKHAFPDLVKLVTEHKEIKVILVETPILGESSDLAARYALAAKGFGKYLEMHAALMKFNGPKTEEIILKLAKELGIDPAKLKEAAAKPEIQAQLDKNMELFRALGLNGTPAFAAEDRVIQNFMGPDMLVQIAKELGDKAK